MSGYADAAIAILPSDRLAGASTERFQRLQRWRAYFLCMRHDHKVYGWDGRQRAEDPTDLYQMEIGTLNAPGARGEDEAPLDTRRPSTPTNIARCIVETLTDLLFDDDRKPQFMCEESEEDQRWFRELADLSNYWDECVDLRDMGGSAGGVCQVFHFDEGRPVFQAIDPKHCIPTFFGVNDLRVKELRIQYAYESEEIRTLENHGVKTEIPVTVKRWFRRDLNDQEDIAYDNPEYKENEPPKFKKDKDATVNHRYGVCPAVWFQNKKMSEQIDGLPDYFAGIDMIDQVDYILSQCTKAVKYNTDPTIHLATDRAVSQLKTGSFDTVQTEAKGKVSMVETNGMAVEAAMKYCTELSSYIQMTCRVRVQATDNGSRDRVTATEISRADMMMFANASRLRRQYGPGIIRMMHLVSEAAHAIAKKPRMGADGAGPVSMVLDLPDGVPNLPSRPRPRLKLKWGRFFQPSPAEFKALMEALSAGLMAGLIDRASCVEQLSPYFPYKDSKDILAAIEAERAKALENMGPFTGVQHKLEV